MDRFLMDNLINKYPLTPRKWAKKVANWDILIPFEDLKSVETPPPMGGCLVWSVGGLVGQNMWNH